MLYGDIIIYKYGNKCHTPPSALLAHIYCRKSTVVNLFSDFYKFIFIDFHTLFS